MQRQQVVTSVYNHWCANILVCREPRGMKRVCSPLSPHWNSRVSCPIAPRFPRLLTHCINVWRNYIIHGSSLVTGVKGKTGDMTFTRIMGWFPLEPSTHLTFCASSTTWASGPALCLRRQRTMGAIHQRRRRLRAHATPFRRPYVVRRRLRLNLDGDAVS